ncbi:MAG: MFS transporter [Betaproteobacteria bacterium]|nr:MFS transporter [Betaproteobacteria bacterium]
MKNLIDIKREEWPAFLWSFAYFFFLLCAYYVLRPVRDEMGIQGGIKNLPWLFTGTFIGMLTVTPLFGWITSRWPRRIFLPLVYLFFVVNLLLFYLAMQTTWLDKTAIAASFFIWLSVFNYFVVSVFWSFMSDVFDSARAKRLFGGIAAGGSIGAMSGPVITAGLVKQVGIPNLLLISAVLLGAAVICIMGLGRWAQQHASPTAQAEEPMGGNVFDGIKLMFTSPFLLMIGGYIALGQALGTVFYLEQLRLVAEIPSAAERTQLFAELDLAVNVLTLLVQILITSAVIQRWGILFCLTVLPTIGVITLGITGLVPTLVMVSVFTVIRRSAEFAVSKPAREVLFTMVTREERYKAKNVMDTIVSRGSDWLASWGHGGLRALGLGTAQMAFAAIPLALVMLGTGFYLGRSQQQREARQETLKAAPL